MILCRGILPRGIGAQPSGLQRLVDEEVTPAAKGLIAVQALAAGASLLDCTAIGTANGETANGESAAVVLSGSADWKDSDGSVSLGPGDGVLNPAGDSWHLTATSDGTSLLLLHAGSGNGNATNQTRSSPAAVTWRYTPPGRTEGVLAAVGGFSDMGVQWLATSATAGSAHLVVAASTFQPGGSHKLHQHRDADEYFLVVEGGGEHLSTDGTTRMDRGDLVFIPAGEWHGYRTDPGVTTMAIYGYLGAGSLAEAGYEVTA